ncbi:uncharacterized protein BDZ99DRAFT_344101, partial [Mytilinidion resinicola]
PALSAADFGVYNRMAVKMDYYHNHFRATWNTLHGACVANARPAGMSMRQFIATGLDFCAVLEMHHGIEEAHIFPVLARKMPRFRDSTELLGQHAEIHAGLERLKAYLEGCRRGERELRLGEVRGVLDGFGVVLWAHLEEEVRELGAENMRRYWSREEMGRMP